jgi:hypothetical protein
MVKKKKVTRIQRKQERGKNERRQEGIEETKKGEIGRKCRRCTYVFFFFGRLRVIDFALLLWPTHAAH